VFTGHLPFNVDQVNVDQGTDWLRLSLACFASPEFASPESGQPESASPEKEYA